MPILSGFLPIPLAMMIPFMGAQSLVLGKAFGEGFQYGKRKISSMTNEEFNKLTPSDIAANSRRELQQMIPEMKASITDMRDFQSFIVHELIATAKQLPDDIFSGITGQGKGTPAGDAFDLTASAFGLPKAFADDGKTVSGGGTKFVTDYESEARKLPFALLANIVEKMLSGKLTNPIERRIAYIKVYKERLPPKTTPKTVPDAIKASGATGDVKKIATMYAKLKQLLYSIGIYSKPRNAGQVAVYPGRKKNAINQFLADAKIYNRFVQSIRKANLTIDTAKSLAALKMIPKT